MSKTDNKILECKNNSIKIQVQGNHHKKNLQQCEV